MQEVDPLTYPDWNERLLGAPHASIFHTVNWLRVLQEAYGYRSHYFADLAGPQPLVLLPFLEVKSWLTGVRGVSLPFSDYCEPLVDETARYPALLEQVVGAARRLRWKCLEMRGGDALLPGVPPYTVYYRHTLMLREQAADVFARLRSNYRAKIRKAGRNTLTVHVLRSPDAMAEYYRLHCLTRKRHGLPPQPALFFKKIHEHVVAKNFGVVVLVSHQGHYVSGAVFLYFGSRALYKFGASDIKYRHLYPVYWLFWQTIQWLIQHGVKELCFGRTEKSHQGLVHFKDGWGTNKSHLQYFKFDVRTGCFVQAAKASTHRGFRLLQRMPVTLLKWTGAALYPHLG
jgi:hypothetical protein